MSLVFIFYCKPNIPAPLPAQNNRNIISAKLRGYKEEWDYFFGPKSDTMPVTRGYSVKFVGQCDIFHVNDTTYVVKKGVYKNADDFLRYLTENNHFPY